MAPVRAKKEKKRRTKDPNSKSFSSWFNLLKKGKGDGAKISEGKITQLELVVHDEDYYYVVYSKCKTSGITADSETTSHK